VNKLCCILLLIGLVWLSSLHAQPEIYIDQIILKGATAQNAADAIKSLHLDAETLYTPDLIPLLKQQLTDYYSQKGYIFAKISQPEVIPTSPKLVNLLFLISEGKAGWIDKVSFFGNRYFSLQKLSQLTDLKPGKKIHLTDLPELQNKILLLYTSRGYLFTSVRLDSLKLELDSLCAVLQIDEGPLFKPERIAYKGNKITRPNTLLLISGISPNSVITPQLLIQAENNLLRKPYIKACQITPMDARTLEFSIDEGKMTRLEGILGMTSNRITARNELNGFADIQFLNLWGTDRSLSLYWKSLSTRYQQLRMAYHESGIYRYPLAGDLAFQRTAQDSTWIKLKVELDIYYRMLYQKVGVSLYTETLYPGLADSVDIAETAYRKLGFFWDYTKLDYIPNPTRGNSFMINFGWLSSQSAAQTKQIPVTEFDAATYLPLSQSLILSISAHGREIRDRSAAVFEQYNLGGFKSLRGYKEDQFNGWQTGWINTELRYLISRDARLYILADAGGFHAPDNKPKTDLFASGLGISFPTKLGIFSLSYALSYTDKRLSDIASGIIHIGIDSSF
jgi:outer membrane protein assembly factor BamA